jgi:hypothetical protein
MHIALVTLHTLSLTHRQLAPQNQKQKGARCAWPRAHAHQARASQATRNW